MKIPKLKEIVTASLILLSVSSYSQDQKADTLHFNLGVDDIILNHFSSVQLNSSLSLTAGYSPEKFISKYMFSCLDKTSFDGVISFRSLEKKRKENIRYYRMSNYRADFDAFKISEDDVYSVDFNSLSFKK